jgi:hypothetical protein
MTMMMASDIKSWIDDFWNNYKEDNKMMKVVVTQTDTFGGEANYSWANRYEFVINQNTSQRNITRKAKALVGMTGVKADTYDYDTGLTIKPRGYNQVIFVDFE